MVSNTRSKGLPTHPLSFSNETLNGKQTFHATQVAAWQRGPAPNVMFDQMTPSAKRVVDVPDVMNCLFSINMPAKKPTPIFPSPVQSTCPADRSVYSFKSAEATDVVFNILRQMSAMKTSWTTFNESMSTTDPAITTVGYNYAHHSSTSS